jgi:hypothetical protein
MAYQHILRLLPKDTYREYKADVRLVLLSPSGAERSVIEFKSGDNPDSLRGFGVHYFVLDEAARVPYESFVSVMTTVTQTRGKGLIISTPKGRNWFYDVYQWGLDSEHPDWFSMRMPTWANPTVPRESIREMKRNLPEDVFRQEVAAQFLLESAGVFRGINRCVRGLLQPPSPGRRYVMGVDLARLRDYSVIVVMDAESKNVVHFDRFNQSTWEAQYHKIIGTARRYNNAQVIMDSTGVGDAVVESVKNGGVRVIPYTIGGSKAKQQLIDKLRVNIENEKIAFPNIPVLIKELEAYELEVSETGVVKYSAPSGQHDDTVLALALTNWIADAPEWKYKFHNVRGV